MDPTQLALTAVAIGVAIGVAASAFVVYALRLRAATEKASARHIPGEVRTLVRGMDEIVAVVDAAGTVQVASPSASPYGLRRGETLPTDELRDLVRAVRDGAAEDWTDARVRRGAVPGEMRAVQVRVRPLSMTLSAVHLRDRTEAERIEQMRRDFVSNTSHELKTPVGAVTLLAEALASAADDPPQVRVFAERLSGEATRLAHLTARIMNLSRLQSAEDFTVENEVAVDEVVAAAMRAHEVESEATGVTLMRGGERGLRVRGDMNVLTDAVANLISNAIAYSPGGGEVGIGVRSTDEDIVEIAVTDRGTGIAAADRERIFERFYRADQARSRRTGGSGLGLSIVKHAAVRHGGDVRVWSRPGRGSTFTLRLPLSVRRTEKKNKKRRRARSSDDAERSP